jgi:hypothetical protein
MEKQNKKLEQLFYSNYFLNLFDFVFTFGDGFFFLHKNFSFKIPK